MSEHGIANLWGNIKKHPYIASGVVFLGGAFLIYLYYSGSSSSSSSSTAGSGNAYSSYLAAQLQSEQLNGQLAAQTAQITAAANAQTQQVNGAVAVNTANDQAQVDIATIQANATSQIAALQAQLGTTQSNNAATVQVAGINAQTQQVQIGSNTQIALGAQQTGVINNLLSDIFKQSPAYSGSLPQTAGGHSAGTTITNVTNWLNGQSNTTLFTPSQIKQLLNG